jgi:hypothetical protein
MTKWITKDGVSDADLMHAARDMYDVLLECSWVLAWLDEGEPDTVARIDAAISKAQGLS